MSVISLEIINNSGKDLLAKKTANGDNASLMLAKDGSYLWTGVVSTSRYQGWFFGLDNGKLIKIIDDIRPRDRRRIDGLTNNKDSVQKIGPEFAETFLMPGANCLVYEIDKFAPVEIFFDIKDIYDSPEFGRNYRVSKEDGAIIVSFRQEGGALPEVFAAIWGDFGIIEIREEWVKHNYEADRLRGDVPAQRWVFKPAIVRASKIVIATGLTKGKAIDTVRAVWRDMGKDKKIISEGTPAAGNLLPGRITVDDAGLAKEFAANALKMLYVKNGAGVSLRAGLPWFFQVWRRDEAVSLKGVSFFDRAAAREMFWHRIDDLKANNYKFGDSADAVGWLFLRAGEFIKAGLLGAPEKQAVFCALGKTIEKLLVEDTRGSLAVSGPKLTWMDSLPRAGAAIEIQALRLNMYSLAAEIASDKEEKTYYRGLEAAAWIKVRDKFFSAGKLADIIDPDSGRQDQRVRPNVFLAAYAYPELLKKSEWEEVFDNVLADLWFDWGGLSTLDKNDGEFCGQDTGASPAAYHNGDSWFWVNNIAAIVLARLDENKYKQYIDKIFEASVSDILWNGAIGCASEISPAQNYRPAGCVNQAWSAATFLELCREIKK